jgi:1,4-alpha-glucan branching enzyme
VNFLQNHDQIGNRPLGERLSTLVDPAPLTAALAITLLAPMPPLLFMGEEWGSTRPFPFFCDFTGELANAVRQGRRREFAQAYAQYGDEIPDPLSAATFRSAGLDWNERDEPQSRKRLALVRELLTIRDREIVSRLAGVRFGSASRDGPVVTAQWRLGDGSRLVLMANLSGEVAPAPHLAAEARSLWGDAATGELPPWFVSWTIGAT